MAVDSTTKVMVSRTTSVRTVTRRPPRTGRRSTSAPKNPAAGENCQPHQQPRSGLSRDFAQDLSRGEPIDESLGDRSEAYQCKTDDRHHAQSTDGLTIRPDDRPEGAHPGEEDVAEVDHERYGRSEEGEHGRIHRTRPLRPHRLAGRSYCTSTRDRSNGIGRKVQNFGAAPAPQDSLASGSCGQVRDSTVRPVTTTLTGRSAGIRSSSELRAATVRPALAGRLATLTCVRR